MMTRSSPTSARTPRMALFNTPSGFSEASGGVADGGMPRTGCRRRRVPQPRWRRAQGVRGVLLHAGHRGDGVRLGEAFADEGGQDEFRGREAAATSAVGGHGRGGASRRGRWVGKLIRCPCCGALRPAGVVRTACSPATGRRRRPRPEAVGSSATAEDVGKAERLGLGRGEPSDQHEAAAAQRGEVPVDAPGRAGEAATTAASRPAPISFAGPG